MQKKYVLLFCFFISNILIAQLPQNLARFTQTLKNLVAKLAAGGMLPSLKPGEYTVPASGKVTLPVLNEDVEAPPGSTIKISDAGITVIVPAAGGKVTLPSTGGIIQVSSDSTVDARIMTPPLDILMRKVKELSAGETISFLPGDTKVTITPKGVMPPPLEPILNKPAGKLLKGIPTSGGTVDVEGEEITIPSNSTVGIADADKKPIITVSAAGGKVEFPSFSSGGYVGVTIDSEVTLPNKTVIQVPAGKYIAVEEEGVVKITPKGVVPPPLIPPGGKKIPVSSSGEVKLPGGPVKVPKDSTVTELPSGEADITLSSDSSVTLPNKKVIKAPKGSTIKLDKNGLSTVTIPVSKSEVTVSIPDGTSFSVSNPAIIRAAGVPDAEISPGETLTAPEDVTITVIPQGVVPPPQKPRGALAPTDRKPEDVLKTVGNVIQLKAPANITNAQAISGYISVYCAFNELSRFLNGKNLALTFDQFMYPTALRSIKKRRIQVAFKNYIASIFIKPIDEIPQKTIFGLTPTRLQGIYRTLIGDLVNIQAKNFINDKYKEGATVEQDYLNPSTVVLKGQTLINALSSVIEAKRQDYIKELTKPKMTEGQKVGISEDVAAAVVSTILAQVAYLEQYTKISANNETRLDARHVLTELHKQDAFGLEEGYLPTDFLDKDGLLKKENINQAMPQGFWLHEGDIDHLIRDSVVLKAVSLSEDIKDMITIFNDLSLLKVSPEILTTANLEIQGKYFINMQILERIVKEEQNKLYIFIVNVGFYFGGTNRPNESRWVTIARYPNNEYVIVDAQNADRTKDSNLTIIKDEMAKSAKS